MLTRINIYFDTQIYAHQVISEVTHTRIPNMQKLPSAIR